MSVYSIRVTNNGNKPWKFCIFQPPTAEGVRTSTLAWLVYPFKINIGEQITLTWDVQYQVMWVTTGELKPGVVFSPGGSMDVDLNTHNMVSFTAPPPTLSSPTRGGPRGSITVNDGPTVPMNEYSVAVGMGNKAIYAVNAGPRLQHIFTPNPKYWICALRDVDEGQVIDIPANKAEVTFPPDVFTMSATLHNDYDWDIKPVFFFYNKFCIMQGNTK